MSARKAKRPPKARAAKIPEDTADEIRRALLGAQAAVATAVLALDGKGLHGLVANSLRRHALGPIDAVLALAGWQS